MNISKSKNTGWWIGSLLPLNNKMIWATGRKLKIKQVFFQKKQFIYKTRWNLACLKQQLHLQSSSNTTSMDGTAWLVIDPDGKTWTHEDIPCWSTSVCMCLYVYLLVFHDLISGLEHRCILHVDAVCHFHHFLQQLCAIPEKNKGTCWCLSGDYKIMHNTVTFIDTWRCKCRLQPFAANYRFTFHNKNYFNYKNMQSTLIVF